jgi:hypothetical protein
LQALFLYIVCNDCFGCQAIAKIANALPEIANALPEIANALTKIANALPEIANALTKTANALPEIANALTKTANALTKIANALTKIANALTEIANALAEIANALAEIKQITGISSTEIYHITLVVRASWLLRVYLTPMKSAVANAIALHVYRRWAMPTLHNILLVFQLTNRNFCIPPKVPEI